MKNIKPEISVIMAVYNSERFLKEAVDSILNQTFTNFELIIIDDGSTDSSEKIINKYLEADSRIVFLKNIKNLGVITTRNKALDIAKGKYIAIMDSDDLSLAKRLQHQYEYLEKNNDIFLLGGSAIIIDEKSKIRGLHFAMSNKNLVINKLPLGNCIYHSSVMFRNNYSFRYRDKMKYGVEDYDLYLNILLSGWKVTNINEFLIKYRINKKSISNTNILLQDEFAQISQQLFKYGSKLGNIEYHKFNPDRVVSLFNPNINSKKILKVKIRDSFFYKDDFVAGRNLIKVYFRNFGYNLKYVILFIISKFPYIIAKRLIIIY